VSLLVACQAAVRFFKWAARLQFNYFEITACQDTSYSI